MGAVNLTRVRARINNIKKKIYYQDPAPLGLWNVNVLLMELESDWFMPTTVTSNRTIGEEYWDLYITDTTDDLSVSKAISKSTQVEIEGEKYRIIQYTRPRGVTKQWYIRLASTGEKL